MAAHPPVPKITSEQRVGAELRTADDKLMTTQIVVGGRPIAYEPDTADRNARTNVCFSNRPVRVKRFQTIHQNSFEVTRGLVLLYGIGT